VQLTVAVQGTAVTGPCPVSANPSQNRGVSGTTHAHSSISDTVSTYYRYMVKPNFKASIDLTSDPSTPPASSPAPKPSPPPIQRQIAKVVSFEEAKPAPVKSECPILPPSGVKVETCCPDSAPTCAPSYSYPNEPYDPSSLFQALFGSFLAGAAVGGLLVYAFSSTEYVDIDIE